MASEADGSGEQERASNEDEEKPSQQTTRPPSLSVNYPTSVALRHCPRAPSLHNISAACGVEAPLHGQSRQLWDLHALAHSACEGRWTPAVKRGGGGEGGQDKVSSSIISSGW